MATDFVCEDCAWAWPLATDPPDEAECDSCGGALAAEPCTCDPAPDPRRRTMSLTDMARQMREDSERWFPALHERTARDLTIAYTLGLAGEVGEVANLIKKANRGHASDASVLDTIGEELADCLVYLTLLADHLSVDLEAEWRRKREHNETRWGEEASRG